MGIGAVQLLHRNVQRFRGGLVFQAHRRCVSLNSRLERHKEEEKIGAVPPALQVGTWFEVQGLATKIIQLLPILR